MHTLEPVILSKILDALNEKKAVNVQILDVREILSYTDFMVICTGTSNTHVAALVSSVEDNFSKSDKPIYVNSSKDDTWWILDFVEVVVHIFKEDARIFYDLEGLWNDAMRVNN